MDFSQAFLSRPIAHRGYHGKKHLENSIAAFEAAICKGFGIELDVQGLRNGCPVVFHDYSLDRLTNKTGKVNNLTFNELEHIFLKNGELLPTLEEILNLVNGKVPILLEIKDQQGLLGENIGELVEKSACLINSYKGALAVMSFNPFVVRELEKYSPLIPRGLVTDDFFSKDWNFLNYEKREYLNRMTHSKEVKLDFISHNVEKPESPQINLARNRNLPVICWTVRSKSQEKKARKIFDNITFENYLPEVF